MKRFLVPIFALLLAAAPANSGELNDLKFPDLKFDPPKPVRVELKNGMILYMIEDHELPVVDITSYVKIGSAWLPPEKAGLAELTGHVWRSGGTASISPRDLDEKLEFMGAGVETSIGADSGTIGMKVMSRDLDGGLTLFADIVRNPAFDEKRFAVVKEQISDGIRRMEDEPDALVDREFHRLLFKGHPFGVFPTLKTVEGLTAADCSRFYKDHVGPESFILGISGDFKPADMAARFEKLFAGFKPAKEKFGKLPQVEDKPISGVYLLDRKVPQTAIRFGHIGISRKDPDFQAARVMNYVLGGGGFSSHLMKDVRTVRGLAYSVWSYFSGGDATKGAFMIGGETKAATTAEFISVSRDLMRKMAENGTDPAEIESAKEAIINSFIFAFDKNSDVLGRYLWIEYYGMPKDYLEKFRDDVRAVTSEKAALAAKRHLHPDNVLIVAVGDADVVRKGLETFGPVTVIEQEK